MGRARNKPVWLNWQIADDAAKLFPNTLADILLKMALSTKKHSNSPDYNAIVSSEVCVYAGDACITVDLHKSDKRNALLGPLLIDK
jgi:hypothetical protein